MPGLPSGTVTLLFIDIEHSTQLLRHLGDQYADLLADYLSLLRDTLQKWGGQEVDTQGEGVFTAFPRARNAVRASVAIQRSLTNHPWPQGVTVRARIGVHTGEPLAAATGYVGMDVHRAARIGAAGHGGQILLSETTRDLVARICLKKRTFGTWVSIGSRASRVPCASSRWSSLICLATFRRSGHWRSSPTTCPSNSPVLLAGSARSQRSNAC